MNLKSNATKRLKKSAALCMAALLGFTAAPAPVFAEGTYTETEKAIIGKALKESAAQYAKELKDLELLKSGIHEDMTLRLEDAGRSILGMVAPVDLSWFKDVNLSADVSMDEGVQFMDAGLYMNDSKICTIQYYFDLENLNIYMKIPELREGYIKVDYAAMLEAEQEALASEELPEGMDSQLMEQFNSAEFMKGYMTVLSNPQEYLPAPQVLESLFDKYGTMLFDYTEDVNSREETITVCDISENCTLYEGQLSSEALVAFSEDLLTALKADEDIKALLNTWDENLEEADGLYQTFLDLMEEGLQELTTAETDEAETISSLLWIGEDGKTAGRSIVLNDGAESVPIFTWQLADDGTNYGEFLQIGPDEEGFTLIGSGQVINGIQNGSYDMYAEGTPVLNMEISDLDVEASKNGSLYEKVKLSFIPPEDDPDMAVMANFAFLMDFAVEDNSGKMDFSLASANVPLAVLSIEVTEGAAVEKPDLADITEVYDAMDETAMNEYMSGVSMDVLFANVVNAGMPEELLMELLFGSEDADAELYDNFEEPVAEENDAA